MQDIRLILNIPIFRFVSAYSIRNSPAAYNALSPFIQVLNNPLPPYIIKCNNLYSVLSTLYLLPNVLVTELCGLVSV